MKKLVCVAFLVSTLISYSAAYGSEQQLPEVGVITLEAATVALTSQLNGRAVAYAIAEVRPQVNGIIQKRLFEEGANVKANTPLYQIDPSMYQAQLDSAKAVLAKAEAQRDVAETKNNRYEELMTSKAVSQQDYDEVAAAFKETAAQVGVAEADVKIAQINLDYTRVLAPLDGHIGKSSVTEGALVTANQTTPLAVIQQFDPIYVDVAQSSVGILELKKAMDKGILQNTGQGKGVVRLVLENGDKYDHDGEILFSEVTVDQSTGSVAIRAVFPNPDWDLLPGMYVKAIVGVAEKDGAITVPQPGLFRNPDGSAFVYVVGDDGTVERRAVTIVRDLKDSWLIDEGLKEGEKVIVEGSQRVRFVPGSPAPRVKPVETTINK